MGLHGVVDVLRDIVGRLRECVSESQVQNVIASVLGCRKRVRLRGEGLPDFEVDVLCDGFALEVKFEANYYDGFCQVVAYRELFGLEDVFLVHVRKNFNESFFNALRFLSKGLKVPLIAIFLDRLEVVVIQ